MGKHLPGVCAACGGPTWSRLAKQCGGPCYRATLGGPGNPQWKDAHDAQGAAQGRDRAARRLALGPCERCAAPARDRHHRDGDPRNNGVENLAPLCRGCHMEADGRLEAFREMARAQRITARDSRGRVVSAGAA